MGRIRWPRSLPDSSYYFTKDRGAFLSDEDRFIHEAVDGICISFALDQLPLKCSLKTCIKN